MKLSPDYRLAVGTGAQEGDIGSRGRRSDSCSRKMHVDSPDRHLICHRMLLSAALASKMRGWRSVNEEGSEVCREVISGLVELLAWTPATGIFTQLPGADQLHQCHCREGKLVNGRWACQTVRRTEWPQFDTISFTSADDSEVDKPSRLMCDATPNPGGRIVVDQSPPPRLRIATARSDQRWLASPHGKRGRQMRGRMQRQTAMRLFKLACRVQGADTGTG